MLMNTTFLEDSFLIKWQSRAGKMFPAAWGYLLMQDGGFNLENLWYLLLVLAVAAAACGVLLRKKG